jgi:uncharacterized protein YceK
MKTHFLKAICGLTLIGLTSTALTGCCTTLTLQKAKGSSHTDKQGKTIVDEKPEPAAYALLPVAAIGDVATLPFWVVVTMAVNLGLMKPGI